MLALFEGVATGAADGYARMAGEPGGDAAAPRARARATAFANLHNARKARTPMVNIVGDHATYHKPLRRAAGESDIEARRRHRVALGAARRATPRGRRGATPPRRSRPRGRAGQVATLILPADAGWERRRRAGAAAAAGPRRRGAADEAVEARRARCARGEPARAAARRRRARASAGLRAAARIAAGDGRAAARARRSRRGSRAAPGCRGRSGSPYLAELAVDALAGLAHLVAGRHAARRWRSSPTRASRATSPPDDCEVHVLAAPGEDARRRARGAGRRASARRRRPACAGAARPGAADRRRSTARRSRAVVGALLPEGAIVVDEAVTASALSSPAHRRRAARTTGCTLTGGAIG